MTQTKEQVKRQTYVIRSQEGEKGRLRRTDSGPRSVSLAMRRHHDQGNSYLGKHLIVSLLTDSPQSSWQEENRPGARAVPEIFIS